MFNSQRIIAGATLLLACCSGIAQAITPVVGEPSQRGLRGITTTTTTIATTTNDQVERVMTGDEAELTVKLVYCNRAKTYLGSHYDVEKVKFDLYDANGTELKKVTRTAELDKAECHEMEYTGPRLDYYKMYFWVDIEAGDTVWKTYTIDLDSDTNFLISNAIYSGKMDQFTFCTMAEGTTLNGNRVQELSSNNYSNNYFDNGCDNNIVDVDS